MRPTGQQKAAIENNPAPVRIHRLATKVAPAKAPPSSAPATPVGAASAAKPMETKQRNFQ
jgi:hypothetical protein